MSLTLRADITATQTTIDVNGTDVITDGDVFAIESEYLLVRGTPTPDPRRSWQRVSIAERGNGGSAKAAHSSGAALTAANAFAGGGGGAGTPRLLGPFPIAWDTPAIHGDVGDFLGVHLATLTEGDLILRAYTFVTAVWDGAQVLQLNLGNADVAGDEGLFTIEHLNLSTSNVPPVPTVYFGEASGGFVFPPGPRGAIVGPDCDLLAQIADTAATQGTADIYLLVVTLA